MDLNCRRPLSLTRLGFLCPCSVRNRCDAIAAFLCTKVSLPVFITSICARELHAVNRLRISCNFVLLCCYWKTIAFSPFFDCAAFSLEFDFEDSVLMLQIHIQDSLQNVQVFAEIEFQERQYYVLFSGYSGEIEFFPSLILSLPCWTPTGRFGGSCSYCRQRVSLYFANSLF